MYFYYFCKDRHFRYNPYLKAAFARRSDWKLTTHPDQAHFTGCSRRKKLLNDPYEVWAFFNRKEYLAGLLAGGVSYYPQSYVIKNWNGNLSNEITSQVFLEKQRWFVKGNVSYGGKAVFLMENMEQLKRHLQKGDTYILQKEILPKLIDGRKFDMRWYIIVTSIGSEKHVFLYEDGYVRQAKKTYKAAGSVGRDAYLTNVTHGFKNVKTEMMRIMELPYYREMLPNVMGVTRQLFSRMIDSLFTGEGDKEGFTFLGIDVILDQDDRPYILEVNNRVGFLPCLISNKIRLMHEKMFAQVIDAVFLPILEKRPLESVTGWHLIF